MKAKQNQSRARLDRKEGFGNEAQITQFNMTRQKKPQRRKPPQSKDWPTRGKLTVNSKERTKTTWSYDK